MKKKATNNVKLGLFTLAGLLFLMLMLYFIGKDQNLFGPTFVVKARFDNVQGLVPGNNVRYAGIEAGTVKKLKILNDTLIEVSMIIDTKLKPFIRNNALASIGTDGLMGNKVVNITAVAGQAPLIQDGDILFVKKGVDMDQVLQTLNNTNNDVAVIAGNLKTTVIRINNSTALWKLMNDNSIPENLRLSAANAQLATSRAASMANDLQMVIADVKAGKGSLGVLLKDTGFANALNTAVAKITEVGEHADKLALTLDESVREIRTDMQSGGGPANALLKDSSMVVKLNSSLDNIQKGTEAFSQNMEALKHNFLFRGYFRRLEKQKQKTATGSATRY
jgi:phospholipid/cholesterol/gamma-HCH transport system substrate-binding protein